MEHTVTISMSDIVRQARKEGKQQAERELSNTISGLEKMLLEQLQTALHT